MRRSLASVLLVCLSIVACVGIPLSSELDVAFTARQTKLAPPDLNINVGGTRVGRFMGDQYPWLVGVANTDQFEKANAVIGGAEAKNAPMYKSHRYGKRAAGTTPWGYDIPVAEPGTYGCTVHFAETDSTAFKNGERVFDLSIQGEGPATTFKGIDVFRETKGGMFVVLTKTAPKVVVAGTLKVRVAKTPASPHGAFMAGITCERTGKLPAGVKPAAPPAGAITPPSYMPIGNVFPGGPVVRGKALNVNSGGGAVGRFIADNTVYLRYGSSTVFHKKGHPIGGSEAINKPAMDTTRYGLSSDWGYQIPIASPGKWACTMHFAELVSNIKAGERVFHVQVQDQVIKNVDVMAGTGGAPFTSFTRTVDEVIVADSMTIRFIQVKGNPFVNAVTCELGSPMTMAAAKKLLAARAVGAGVKPPVTLPAPTPPTPEANATGAAPTPDTSATDPTTNDTRTGTIPEETAAAPAAILTDITLETTPEAAAGEVQQPYELLVSVLAGTDVNAQLRDAVKRTMSAGSKVPVEKWGITTWTVADPPVTNAALFALAAGNTSFAVTAVAALTNETATETNNAVSAYLVNGAGTTELQKTYPGAEIRLANPIGKALGGSPDVAKKTGNTSVIVAAVVGSALGLLLIVALIAFFVIQRHRRSEVNPAIFDEPPPLSDSDGEAPSSSAHSELDEDEDNSQPRGNNSIDYLDDDSTFTAATSRQGDPENGVTLDKDVWGRGSS